MLTNSEYKKLLKTIPILSDDEIEWAYELIEEYEAVNKIIEFKLTDKQKIFVDAREDEVLFGGAAGGGKSYAQLIDAWRYAILYPGIKQLVLRRTFPELNRSLIMNSVMLFNQKHATYKQAEKKWHFNNGSTIEFGYCQAEIDVQQYQSAEYDVIRFDELTHFTEFQYTYLISRLRGVNNFPKQIKSSTNPGSSGHVWVKNRFIDDKIPMEVFSELQDDGRLYSYVFIPAKVQENTFLMDSNPGYINKLKKLPEKERKALLDGSWDLLEGAYFDNWNRDKNVIEPFEIPKEWRKFISLDYGLDMTAAHWWAKDRNGRYYIYQEFHQPNLNLTQAAKMILELTEDFDYIEYVVASPDLWNRRQETGTSGKTIMENAGLTRMKKANDSRVIGWRTLREFLEPYLTEKSQLVIFNTCKYILKYIPQLQRDTRNPEDVSDKPHSITHAPESVRYGIMSKIEDNAFLIPDDDELYKENMFR